MLSGCYGDEPGARSCVHSSDGDGLMFLSAVGGPCILVLFCSSFVSPSFSLLLSPTSRVAVKHFIRGFCLFTSSLSSLFCSPCFFLFLVHDACS